MIKKVVVMKEEYDALVKSREFVRDILSEVGHLNTEDKIGFYNDGRDERTYEDLKEIFNFLYGLTEHVALIYDDERKMD